MSKVTNPIDALRVLGHSRVRVIETPVGCVPQRCNFITPFDFFASSSTIMCGYHARLVCPIISHLSLVRPGPHKSRRVTSPLAG